MANSDRRLPIRNYGPRRMPHPFNHVSVSMTDIAEVTVVVRSKGSDAEWSRLLARATSGLPGEREYLTRAEFGTAWAASEEDLAAVRKFGEDHGLTAQSDSWRRCVVLAGSLARLQEAFGVDFEGVETPLGRFRTHRGQPHVDPSIHSIVETVLGLENVPTSQKQLAMQPAGGSSKLNLPELRTVYDFPPQFTGNGQCVAVIELGGGLDTDDYNEYFRRIGVAPPRLVVETIGGAMNQPAPRQDVAELVESMLAKDYPPKLSDAAMNAAEWTCETAMDVQIVGTLAPDATILLVFAPGDDQGQYHAITSVLADTRNAPSVISCSWSDVESNHTRQLAAALDPWLEAAAVLGVTTCFSSGDNGDGTIGETKDLTFTTTYPASHPYVLGCGGTTLDVEAGTEVAWLQNIGVVGGGGGGFSELFDLPPWQISAGIDYADWIPPVGATSGRGRGVPDVSAIADFAPEFSFLVAGIEAPAGGTSEACPLWAALIAVLNQALDKSAGSINRLLYEGGLHRALRDITRGTTGHLDAREGWDPCTGWGSPHGEALLEALRGTPSPGHKP